MHGIRLGTGQNRFNKLPQLFGLGQGGVDSFVHDQGDGHVTEHRLAMTVGPTEVVNGISVAHIVVFSGASLGFRGLVFVEFVFVNIHAKSEALFSNQILQFGEGFFAEIPEFQQVGNVKLDQIGQGTDFSSLKAIESTN